MSAPRRIAWTIASLVAVACGSGGGNGEESDDPGTDEGPSCPAIACSPELNIELSPGLGVGTYEITYTVEGAETNCVFDLKQLASSSCPVGGVAGAPCMITAPMVETDCTELGYGTDIETGQVASFSVQGEPTSLDIELRDGDGNVVAGGSFEPDYAAEDDGGGCGCGGASIMLEINGRP